MNKLNIIIIVLFILSSCKKEAPSKPVSLQKTAVPTKTVTKKVSVAPDDFSDFKKEDDESCDSEEELLKKQIEKAQKAKSQAVKLQGAGDGGCTID